MARLGRASARRPNPLQSTDQYLIVDDLATAADTVAVVQIRELTDTGTGTDAVLRVDILAVTETGTGTDTVVAVDIVSKSSTDTATGTDSVVVVAPVLKTSDDAGGTGTDTVSFMPVTLSNDGGTGTDTTAIARASTVTDAANGTDTAAVQRGSTSSDTATETDVVAVLRIATVTETGVGTDTVAILRISAVTDTATGTDSTAHGPYLPTDVGVGTDEVVVIVIPFTQVLPLRLGPVYDLVVVARVPQTNGPPAFIEVDPIEWTSLEVTNTLSKAQELTVECLTAGVTETVLQRLRAPDVLATELWLLRNGQRIFAGPLQSGRTSGETLTLQAAGVLAYLGMMVVDADMRFDQIDQFQIVKSLVDQWQVLDYGNFGVDTSSVGTSGVLRDGSYIAVEQNNIAQRVEELGKRQNGFDIEVDPATRKLQLWYPQKGVDRSVGEDAVVFDARNITSSDIMFSLATGDLASEAYGTGTSSGAAEALSSKLSNLPLRARYGRSAVSASWSDVSEQTTLDAHTQGLLDARAATLMVPGPRVRVTPDADLSSYSVGDTVSYELSGQLGVSGAFRIRQQKLSVSSTGQESVDLQFV